MNDIGLVIPSQPRPDGGAQISSGDVEEVVWEKMVSESARHPLRGQ